MGSAHIFGKELKCTYTHPQRKNATIVQSTLAFSPKNEVTAVYNFSSDKGELKYAYIHGLAATTRIEPAFDFGTSTWNFSMIRKISIDDTIRATYNSFKYTAELEWSKNLKDQGPFKVSSW